MGTIDGIIIFTCLGAILFFGLLFWLLTKISNWRSEESRAARKAKRISGTDNVRTLLKQLEKPDAENRRDLISRLIEIGAPAVDHLLPLLATNEPKLQSDVIDILGEIGDQRAVEPLMDLLNHQTRKSTTDRTLLALGKIGGEKVTGHLLNQLEQTEEENSKRIIITALGETQNPTCIGPLINAFKTAERKNTSSTNHSWELTRKALLKIGAQSIPACIEALSDKNEPIVQGAKETLEEFGEEAVEPLLAAAGNGQQVHEIVISVLENIGKPAVPALTRALTDGSSDLSTIVLLKILKSTSEKKCLPSVIPFLQHEDKSIQKQAIEVIKRIGGKEAIEPLKTVLNNDSDLEIKKEAADTLEFYLKWKPDDHDETAIWYWIFENKADKCVRFGDKVIEPLLTSLPLITNRYSVINALDALGWEPGNDEAAAWYWITQQNWEKCAALGVTAVNPLIQELGEKAMYEHGQNRRTSIAKCLVEIYQKSNDPTLRETIKKQRKFITSTHTDETRQEVLAHHDIDYGERNSDCSGHDDDSSYGNRHHDFGKLVEFPL